MANAVQGNRAAEVERAAEPVDQMGREFIQLSEACIKTHKEKGKFTSAMIGLAVLITAIWVGVLVNSILLGAAIFLIGGSAASKIYHNLRNSDYMDARDTLKSISFRQYIQRNNLALSVDSILKIHQEYKKHLAVQAANLAQQAHA